MQGYGVANTCFPTDKSTERKGQPYDLPVAHLEPKWGISRYILPQLSRGGMLSKNAHFLILIGPTVQLLTGLFAYLIAHLDRIQQQKRQHHLSVDTVSNLKYFSHPSSRTQASHSSSP